MFQHHPDGRLLIDGQGITLQEFNEHEPAYALPDGAIGRVYIPGQRHTLTDGQTQWGGPMPWPDGDRYLADAETYQPAAPPEPTLDELKATKKREIETARDAAIDAGVSYSGYAWQTDKQARENITGTLTAVVAGVPLPADFTWRTEDNQDVPMDAAGLTALAGTVLAHVNTQYQQSWTRKAEIDAAADAAAVVAVVW